MGAIEFLPFHILDFVWVHLEPVGRTTHDPVTAIMAHVRLMQNLMKSMMLYQLPSVFLSGVSPVQWGNRCHCSSPALRITPLLVKIGSSLSALTAHKAHGAAFLGNLIAAVCALSGSDIPHRDIE
jgi:hypothetical protein